MSKKIGGKMFGGNVPKGKGGSRPLDAPGCGKPASGSNQTMPMTSPAGGKMPKSMGGNEGKACANPKPKCYAQGPQGKHAGDY